MPSIRRSDTFAKGMPPRHPFLRPWSRYCARTPIMPLGLRGDDRGVVDRDRRRNGRAGDHKRERRSAVAALVTHDCRDIDRHSARGCRGDGLRGSRHGDTVFERRDGICTSGGRRERDAGIDIEIALALKQDTVTRQDCIAAETADSRTERDSRTGSRYRRTGSGRRYRRRYSGSARHRRAPGTAGVG